MKNTMLLGFVAAIATISAARADPVPLSSYADANGFIDVQALHMWASERARHLPTTLDRTGW